MGYLVSGDSCSAVSGLSSSGRVMLRLQIGIRGASPRATFGSCIKATRPTGSSLLSRILTMNGRRFSRKEWKFMYSCSPDFVTGTKLPPISKYRCLPSSTYKSHMSVNFLQQINCFLNFKNFCILLMY